MHPSSMPPGTLYEMRRASNTAACTTLLFGWYCEVRPRAAFMIGRKNPNTNQSKDHTHTKSIVKDELHGWIEHCC